MRPWKSLRNDWARLRRERADDYTQSSVPKSTKKPKSAMDKLVESFLKLRAEAKERMSEEEFREADRQFHELANKVRARRRRAIRP